MPFLRKGRRGVLTREAGRKATLRDALSHVFAGALED